MCSKFVIKHISCYFLVILYTFLEISHTPSRKNSRKQRKAPSLLVKCFHLSKLLLLLLYLASYQNCDKGQLVLEKVKKGRKVALIFPKPGWRGNSHILPVYETGAGSLLNWPAEEGHPRSGIGVLESL